MEKLKAFLKEWKKVFIELFMIALMIFLVISLFGLLFVDTAHCQPTNKDWQYLDSTFRSMEKRTGGGSVDFKNRVFNISQPIPGPRTDGSIKVFTIDNLILKGAGLYFTEKDVNAAGTQTNRTIIMHSFNVYNADVGLIVQGSHRSYFECVSAYSCRKGGSFEFCLEGKALNLQEHQCRDTGFYIGWCRNLPGGANYNSQSNNFCITGMRSFASGTEIAFIFDGVSGCNVNSCTDEGNGAKIFLKVTAKGSNVVKDFTASGFHVEFIANDYNKIVIQAECNGYSTFTFSGFYPQTKCTLIDGSGLGLINVANIYYQSGDAKLSSACPADSPTWWQLINCASAPNYKGYYNTFYWITDNTHCRPNPFATGQETNSSGSNRLKEMPYILN